MPNSEASNRQQAQNPASLPSSIDASPEPAPVDPAPLNGPQAANLGDGANGLSEAEEHDAGHPNTAMRRCSICKREWRTTRYQQEKEARPPAYTPVTTADLLSVNPRSFWARVEKTNDCWEWAGQRTKGGYGVFKVPSRQTNTSAHRIAWALSGRPLDPGAELDHVCRNRGCVNPLHLEAVTPRENTLRSIGPSAINARKTHCKWGHEFTPENTYTPPGRGGRYCRACRSERDQRRKSNAA